jgi:hypothetical protein
VPCNDNPTRFFFRFGLPSLSLSFFIYGLFPIICLRIGLVDQAGSPMAMVMDDPLKDSRKKLNSVMKSVPEDDDEEETTTDRH